MNDLELFILALALELNKLLPPDLADDIFRNAKSRYEQMKEKNDRT